MINNCLNLDRENFQVDNDMLDLENTRSVRVRRGFGCSGPWNRDEYECNRHCKSNRFRGGYCNAFTGWLRCDCY